MLTATFWSTNWATKFLPALNLTWRSDPIHLIASISGVNAETAPVHYVEKLFDDYADKFDASLVSNLQYQMPAKLGSVLQSFSKGEEKHFCPSHKPESDLHVPSIARVRGRRQWLWYQSVGYRELWWGSERKAGEKNVRIDAKTGMVYLSSPNEPGDIWVCGERVKVSASHISSCG